MTRSAGLGLALAGGFLAAGCGGSSGFASESVQQIVKAVSAAFRAASSTTLNGSETKKGVTISISATVFSNGDISGSINQNGSTAELIKIGATDYLKADASYYTSNGTPPALAARLANTWISIPDSSALIGAQFSFGALANQLLIDNGSAKKGSTATINRQAAIAIISPKIGTLWVATGGTPYPIESIPPASQGIGSLSFSNWNEGKIPTAPAGAVPATSFQGGTGASGPSGASGATGASGTSGTSSSGSTGTRGTAPAGPSGSSGSGATSST